MHAGIAPVPTSFGYTNRHRLSRGGSRQLNAALHRVAITQIRPEGPVKTCYQNRRAQGNSSMDALHALKQKIARRVFKTLTAPATSAAAITFAAAA